MALVTLKANPATRNGRWLARVLLLLLAATLAFAEPQRALAAVGVSVTIDLSTQRMHVSIGGRPSYNWAVSTARPGYRTPTGRFHPIRLERVWYSSIYDSAPMPYSVFFYGGYAIHGTYETSNLGRAVSHGCVRLHPGNARTLFNLILKYGRANTLISIVR